MEKWQFISCVAFTLLLAAALVLARVRGWYQYDRMMSLNI